MFTKLKKMLLLAASVGCLSVFGQSYSEQQPIVPVGNQQIDFTHMGQLSINSGNMPDLQGGYRFENGDALFDDINWDYSVPLRSAQQMVSDKNGNVLFYIRDNYIFNKNGQAMFYEYEGENGGTITSDATLIGENSEFENPSEIPNFGQTSANELDYKAFRSMDFQILPSIIVLPIPGNCYEYYVIFGLKQSIAGEGGGKSCLFYKKIKYIDENNLEVSKIYSFFKQYSLSANESQNLQYTATNYRTQTQDYLIFVNGRKDVYPVDDPNSIYIYNFGVNGVNSEYNGTPIPINTINLNSSVENIELHSEMEIYENENSYYLSFFEANLSNHFKFDMSLMKLSKTGNLITWKKMQEITVFENNTARNHPYGLEFSPNGNYIYYTSKNQETFRAVTTACLENSSNPSFVTINCNNPGNYDNTKIERFADGNLYLVNNSGVLEYITNADTPGNATFNTNTYNISNIPESQIIGSYSYKYTLPHQLDGQNYKTYYENWYYENGRFCACLTEHYELENNGITWPSSFLTVDTWQPGYDENPWDVYYLQDGKAHVYIDENVEIPAGKKVTIKNMKLHFATGKKLTLKAGTGSTRGAELVLDNAILDHDDCGLMWEGVVLEEGSNNIQQGYYTNHPTIQTKAGSEINNAKVAIKSLRGGIIKAYSTTFKNNITDISIYPFSNNNETAMQTYISRCTFVTTQDGLLENEYPSWHISIVDNFGNINLNGNTFENNQSSASVENRGKGIYARNTKVYIKNWEFFTNKINTNFNDLYYGVYLQNCPKFSIKNSNFNDNFHGAYVLGTQDDGGATVLFNNFNVNNSSTQVGGKYAYGLYLEQCDNFTVEENKFYDGMVGIYVNTSAYLPQYNNPNEIYRNRFNNLYMATVAMGINSDQLLEENDGGQDGLVFKCNKYESNVLHIGIDIESNIAKNQGNMDDNSPTSMAGNYFGYTNGLEMFNTGDRPVNYYQHGHPSNMSYQNRILDIFYYTDVNTNKITPCNTYIDTTGACPSNQSTGGIIIFPPLRTLGDLSTQEDIAQDELKTLVDGGNTMVLSMEAESANQSNYQEVKEKLVKVAPYASDEVLVKYTKESINVPSAAKTQALLANSPLSTKTKEEVDNSDIEPLHKYILEQRQQGINAKMAKEMQISNLRAKQQLALNKTMKYYTDSNLLDSAKLLLTARKAKDKTALLEFCANYGYYADALSEIEDLRYDADFNKNPSAQDYLQTMEIKVKIESGAVENVSEYIAQNADFLQEVWKSKSRASATAYAILNQEGLAEHNEETAMLQLNTKSLNMPIGKQQSEYTFSKNDLLKVYPTPATDYVNIEYALLENAGLGNIEVYNAKGELVITKQVNNSSVGIEQVDVSTLPAGTYMIKIAGLDVVKIISVIK